MRQLTYGTLCFEAFLEDFLLGEDDYNIDWLGKVSFKLLENDRHAAVYVTAWDSCLARTPMFRGEL